MRHRSAIKPGIAIAVAAFLPLLSGHAIAQDRRVPDDYLVTEGRLAGGLRPCLEQAAGGYEPALACAKSVFSECVDTGPSGDTTAGLSICSSVSAKIIDAEMNIIWAEIKRDAPAAAFTELLDEQRAWLRMRERDSQAARDRYSGGSMAAYSGGVAYVDMSADRLARLHEIASSY